MSSEVIQQKAALEGLCLHYKVRRLELFGSAALGQDKPGKSDLDFLVDFQPLPAGAYAEAYFGLLEDLEKLFDRPVDLVVASAIKNPYFRESVNQTKILLYAA